MADAAIDSNNKYTLTAVSSVDGKTIVRLWADPVTHRLLVSAGGSGTSSGFQIPTGTVNGSNAIFTFALPPNAVSVDHMTYQKTSSDGTANWTGTTTITLAVAPTSDIFGVN